MCRRCTCPKIPSRRTSEWSCRRISSHPSRGFLRWSRYLPGRFYGTYTVNVSDYTQLGKGAQTTLLTDFPGRNGEKIPVPGGFAELLFYIIEVFECEYYERWAYRAVIGDGGHARGRAVAGD